VSLNIYRVILPNPSVIPDLPETLFYSSEIDHLRKRYALLKLGEVEINHW
jgi:hypothetical protein|tara:strand:- start:17462 stop:17611 length:150 start_codon:yes stop_codon:yes gene_type:complete